MALYKYHRYISHVLLYDKLVSYTLSMIYVNIGFSTKKKKKIRKPMNRRGINLLSQIWIKTFYINKNRKS